MAAGELFETYAAAIQHDLVDLPSGTRRIGVVRRPTPWLDAVVDENRPVLGPPDDLLSAMKDRQETLEAEGMNDATAHNQAMNDVDYDRRYREHLDGDEPRTAIADLQDALRAGEDLALVCFENTDEKRCHRTMLRKVVLRDLSGDFTRGG